jgi:short-subunit dehydrogenase
MAIIVLTGASSGIGEATARLLAREGHVLVIAARRIERLQQLQVELGPTVHPFQADLADPAQVQALADFAGQNFGGIDVWINNAGAGGSRYGWWQHGVEPIRQVLDINLLAPMVSVAAAVPYMKGRPGAQFINIASVAGHIGTGPLYSATKWGLRGFSEALRRELEPHGIKVSIVSPGFVRSEMTAHRGNDLPGPEIVAAAIAHVIRRPRREVVVPGWYRLLIWLERLLPASLSDPLVRKVTMGGRPDTDASMQR